MNERKSHLRSIAVAGTLASVGAFTALAASSTHTTSAAPVVAGQQVQNQTQQGIDDGFTQSPDAAVVSAQDDDFFSQGQNQSGQGGFGGQSSTVAPPQSSVGPGGSGPSMSGGS